MSGVRVSVVIPCYNCSTFVIETLESLAKQEVLPDEVVCVNDGSSDNTEEVIRAYAQDSEMNIILLTQDNAGVSAARNTGIENSRGEILLFLDADDTYAQPFIKNVVTGIEKGYDTVYGWFTHDKNCLLDTDALVETMILDKRSVMIDFMYHKNRCHISAFAYKRALIEERKIRFAQGAKYGEDWEFTTKYLDLCQKALCVAGYMMFYRVNDSSAMHQAVYEHVDAIKSAERVEEYLLEHQSDCYELFSGYMKHRAIFSIAHTFSKYSKKEMFKRLCKEYPVYESMKILISCNEVSIKIKLAAISFQISPWLFYYITGKR